MNKISTKSKQNTVFNKEKCMAQISTYVSRLQLSGKYKRIALFNIIITNWFNIAIILKFKQLPINKLINKRNDWSKSQIFISNGQLHMTKIKNEILHKEIISKGAQIIPNKLSNTTQHSYNCLKCAYETKILLSYTFIVPRF